MTTIEVTSRAQLSNVLSQIGKEVIERVADELLEIFKKQFIDEFVYKHPSSGLYTPTFEFKEAWEFTPVKMALLELTTELWYNWMKMETFDDRESFVHTSVVPDWPQDTRAQLDDWLNRTISSSHFFSPVRRGKYWDEFIQKMVNQNGIDKLFKKYFAEYGIR